MPRRVPQSIEIKVTYIEDCGGWGNIRIYNKWIPIFSRPAAPAHPGTLHYICKRREEGTEQSVLRMVASCLQLWSYTCMAMLPFISNCTKTKPTLFPKPWPDFFATSCYANTPFFCILRNTPEYVVSRAATDRGRAIMMAWLYYWSN